jgi:hypothetical protein
MKEALFTLLADAVDYAGLFPPAALEMRAAVAEYAAHREEPNAWMLGRFVLPAARLDEWAREAPATVEGSPWPLSVLAGSFDPALRDAIGAFNERERGRAAIDTVETRATTPRELPSASLTSGVAIFVEIPIADDPAPMLDAIRGAGVRAKVRTGGTTPESFPSAQQVARFIRRCVERDIIFKATAGLHHPLRAEYRLSYQDGAPEGTMFGFLNVLLATMIAREGGGQKDVTAALEERDPAALTATDEAVIWRGRAFKIASLRAGRTRSITGFGSCSFKEPVSDLRTLGLL